MIKKGIVELHDLLLNGKVTSKELIDESVKMSHLVQEKCNAFVTILDDVKESEITDNFLSGIPYGVKDNYSTKDILSTGSSNTLKDYVPFFTATAVKNLEKSGAAVINKTAMDEFGMGGKGVTAHTGIQRNPWGLDRICGGSSSGSAAAVAAGVYPYALGSDTGDSIRKPAAYCGVVGYKPTYGMISRYGLFAYASSMDHCGVLTRSVEDAAIVVDAMKGLDKYDMTTWNSSSIKLYDKLKSGIKGRKLCYIKEIVDVNNYDNPDEELVKHLENYNSVIDKCRELGFLVEEVSVNKKLLDALSSVYTVISYAEATSNLSNLTGISFGPRGQGDNIFDLMKDYRTKGFSSMIKRRFVIGSYVLQNENQEKYFVNAQRVRRLLVNTWKDLYKTYDGVILPVGTGSAPFIDEKLNNRCSAELLEEHLQIANFGGFPSITIPCGFINDMPVGVNITSDCYHDELLLQMAYGIESTMSYKNQVKEGL